MKRVDVAVIGAGPIGSATAILLAERGLAVALLDRAGFVRPKISGEYVSPEAARMLDRLGVLKDVDASGARPLNGLRVVAPDGTVFRGAYPTKGPWRGYRDHALAVPREVLDRILLERARTLPVRVLERYRVTGIRTEGGRVTGIETADARGRTFEVEARLVVGADGRASIVARALGLVRPQRLRRLALSLDIEGLDDFDEMGEIHTDPPDYCILSPLGSGLANLTLVVPVSHARPFRNRLETFFHARLRQLRHLMPRLERIRPRGRLIAVGLHAHRVAAPRHGGVLLAEDAAGFYDPLASEGLHAALHSAELLVEVVHGALDRGDVCARALGAHAASRPVATRDKQRLVRVLRGMIARRRVADRVVRCLARRPALADTFMGVIGDFVPPRELLRPSSLWQLL